MTTRNRKYFMHAAVSATALLMLSDPGYAQSLALEEIVVTARKRDESIQDIPLSVAAFSANQIKNQQITDVEDVFQFVPGVHMSNHTANRNNPAVRFRAIDPPSSTRNEQTSSAFLDGVYLPTGSQMVSMDDIERVEVVKGPQSAFFGRATFGGAVNFISKTPGDEWGADTTLILGDHARADLWVSAEGPLVEDKLFIRASGRYYTYDGAWENEHPSGGDLGAQQTSAGSVTLYATPSEDLTIKARYMHTVLDDGLAVQFLAKGEQNNCGPFGTGTATYYCGTLSRDLITNGVAIDTSPLEDTTFKDDLGLDRKFDFGSLNIDWDLGGSGYTLTSVTGLYKESTSELRELLTDEIMVFLEWKDKSFSQEVRLASPTDDKLQWMLGLYYLEVEYNNDASSGFPCPGNGPFCADPTQGFAPSGRGGRGLFGVNPTVGNKVENKAIFGSVSYDITEKLTANLEFRYEEETLENATSVIQEAMPLDSSTPEQAILTAQPFGGAEIDLKAKFKAELPRVIIDYKHNDDLLLYASYSKGNNPGGFNPEVIQLEPTVAFPAFNASEGIGPNVLQAGLRSYEGGFKYTLPEARGYFNGAVYFMEWRNQRFRGFTRDVDSNGDGVFIQGSDRLGAQIDYNANGSTDIFGFELAGSYSFNEYWLGTVSYNYNNSDIKVYQDGVNRRVYGDGDASGFDVARSPKHAATFALDFNYPADTIFGQDGDWFARWDGWYQSSTFNWVVNLAKTEKALLHNLRGGWRSDRYSVTAWIENVLDSDKVLASQRTTGSFLTGTLGYQFTLPEPRTFGVTLSASF